jgi:hypothetical protein
MHQCSSYPHWLRARYNASSVGLYFCFITSFPYFGTSFNSSGSLSSLPFLCFVTACQKTRHARSSCQTHVCANCCTGADILPSRFLERQSPMSSFPCTHPLPWFHHIYWSIGLNKETAHVSPKLISVSPHDSVTRAHHLVFRLISTEHSCSHLSTSCAPAATGPSSPFPERTVAQKTVPMFGYIAEIDAV